MYRAMSSRIRNVSQQHDKFLLQQSGHGPSVLFYYSECNKKPSDMSRDGKRRAVAAVIAAQQAVGLLVADDSFGLRIKIQRPS